MTRQEMLRIIGEVLARLETDPQNACIWWDAPSCTDCNDAVARYMGPCSDAVVRYMGPCSDVVARYAAPCTDAIVRYAVLD